MKDRYIFCSNHIYCVRSQVRLLEEDEMPPQPLGVPESLAWVMGWRHPKGEWICPDCLKKGIVKNESR